MTRWLLYFSLTVILEGVIFFVATYKSKLSLGTKLKIILAVNLATHPIVFFLSVTPSLSPGLLSLELFAVGVEAWLYYKMKVFNHFWDSLAISFVCNGFSLVAGTLVITNFFAGY